MEITSTTSIADYVSTLNLPERFSGSQLSLLIRLKFPNFKALDYECRSLRDFVEKHLPGLVVVDMSGNDWIYSRFSPTQLEAAVDSVREVSSSSVSNPANVWKTFASPRTVYSLYANALTGEFQVCPPKSAVLNEPWRRVPSSSTARHVELAQAFIATLPHVEQRQRLEECFGKPLWWLPFFARIKDIGIVDDWTRFRRRELLKEFELSLLKLDIPLHSFNKLFRSTTGAPRITAPRSGFLGREYSEERVRRLAIEIVRKMPIEDLRAIPVRLGDLLDELGE